MAKPDDLHEAGERLWTVVMTALELDERGQTVLAAACRQADDLAALEVLLAEQGPTVTGSTGQERLNPVFAELRQGRLALTRLLRELDRCEEHQEEPSFVDVLRAEHEARIAGQEQHGRRHRAG